MTIIINHLLVFSEIPFCLVVLFFLFSLSLCFFLLSKKNSSFSTIPLLKLALWLLPVRFCLHVM
jgi:hypothetical protein